MCGLKLIVPVKFPTSVEKFLLCNPLLSEISYLSTHDIQGVTNSMYYGRICFQAQISMERAVFDVTIM